MNKSELKLKEKINSKYKEKLKLIKNDDNEILVH